MGLKIQTNADGSFRKEWWGRLSVKGRRRETNLGIPIEGTIPVDAEGKPKLSLKGDADFERSRKTAEKAFAAWRRETQKDPAELQAKAYKARTGEDLSGLPLSKLYSNWKSLMRDKSPTDTWCGVVKTWLADFVKFCEDEAAKKHGRCETVNDVTPEIVSSWYDDLKAKFAWKTVKSKKNLVCGIFARLQASGLARINPFAHIQSRGGGSGEGHKISRKALTLEELDKVLTVAKAEEGLYPLVVTAACTGMRLGDCCNLTWADVDLRQGLITCTTHKTGSKVTIPILGRLADVLADTPHGSDFVFPEAREQYTRNKDKLFRDVKPVFAKALFADTSKAVEQRGDKPTRDLAEALREVACTEAKRYRLTAVYAKIKAGMRPCEIAKDMHIAKPLVSMALREIEKLTGETLRPKAAKSARQTMLDLREKTQQVRAVGQRAACLYGWHSFRHSFVVLALQAGVPVEDVRLIVGHGQTETTLENYYNPQKAHAVEQVRQKMKDGVFGKKKKVAKTSIDDVIACLSSEQKKELARKLLGL